MAEVRREVLSRYGHKLLQLLQSDLPDEKGDGWLGHLLRKSETAVAPLRHLLLLRALEVDLTGFFFHKSSHLPANLQSASREFWPCLNPVCDWRGKSVVEPRDRQPAN